MKKHLAFLVVASVLVLSFQNCGGFSARPYQTDLHQASYNFNSMNDIALVPATDKVDVSCMTSHAYDACIFNKNPVAQGIAPISGSMVASNYDATQIYGVKLTSLSGTGALDNGTFHVSTMSGTKVAVSSGTKFKAQNDTAHSFSQVMAYYWLNRASEYIGGRTGVLQVRGTGINVIVDDMLAGYSSGTNSIHLRTSSAGNPMAWSGELAIHFLGLAALHAATNGAMDTLDASKHVDCNLRGQGCCTSANGCAKAISSGVGDYFAALVFPNQPRIGEAWANDLGGMKLCGLDRDLSHASSTTVQTAYAACTSGNTGDATVMGTVYAAIWWQVRSAAQSQFPQGAMEIDTLFMNHLYDLLGTDDFESAFKRVIELDNYAFAGKHVSLFQSAISAHGL